MEWVKGREGRGIMGRRGILYPSGLFYGLERKVRSGKEELKGNSDRKKLREGKNIIEG